MRLLSPDTSEGTYTLIDYGTFSGVLADFTAPAMVNGLNATLSDDMALAPSC